MKHSKITWKLRSSFLKCVNAENNSIKLLKVRRNKGQFTDKWKTKSYQIRFLCMSIVGGYMKRDMKENLNVHIHPANHAHLLLIYQCCQIKCLAGGGESI